jgi:hypothetical protein
MAKRLNVVLLAMAACIQAQTQGSADRNMAPVIEPFHPVLNPLRPPTQNEQLHEYVKNLLDPVSVVSAAASAAIGQWRNKPQEWGQGGEAFARRMVSSYTQHLVYSTLLFGGASLFHEDDRYLASGRSGFGPRLGYALENTIFTRHFDSHGQVHRRLSISKIGALAGAALISRLWQPPSTGGLRNGIIDIGISLGASGGFNVEHEFLPRLPQ